MSQPGAARPVPGPPRVPERPQASSAPAGPVGAEGPDAALAFLSGLGDRPVAEHVAVFEAEHDRLRRELSAIDQL